MTSTSARRPHSRRWAWRVYGAVSVLGLLAALRATSGDRADMAMAALGTFILVAILAVALDAFLVPPIERGNAATSLSGRGAGYAAGGGFFGGAGGDGGGGGGGCGDGGGGGGGSC